MQSPINNNNNNTNNNILPTNSTIINSPSSILANTTSTAASTLQNLSSWFLSVTNSFDFPPPETTIQEITPRILAMDFPVPPQRKGDKPLPKADERIATYFQQKYGGSEHVMVWNLSEMSYEGLSALEFKFPGHPSAPLGALFELCASLDSWLDAKSNNVAAIHCATGRGRTLTVIACYLAWSGYQGLTPEKALEFACEKKGVDMMEATIPSQRRYVEYFSRALEGVRPRPEPIVLRSARVFGAPGNSTLQIYVDGALVKSVPGKWEGDGQVQLYADTDALLDGDVLIRVRHEDLKTKTRVSIFRVALHTGYTPSGILKLNGEEEIDGGTENSWIEFDFVPKTDKGSTTPVKLSKGLATSEAQFWDLIARRRESNKRKIEEAQAVFSIIDSGSQFISKDERDDDVFYSNDRGGGGGNSHHKVDSHQISFLSVKTPSSSNIPNNNSKKIDESRVDELDAELSTLLSPMANTKIASSGINNNNNHGNNNSTTTTTTSTPNTKNNTVKDIDELDEELEDYLKNLE
jgi:hypothetical protein